MKFARALGATLRHCLETDERVVLLGEDIADPYGGAFKVTRGLSTDFPERVRTTPVSEAAIVGISAGLALAGMRPIVEIMFGDFLALCFDQVVNHIAKYEAMYDHAATCPVIIRSPSGGRRGYGPTHSQSLEKHFLGVPHLRVVAASLWHDPRSTYQFLLAHDEPTLYVEHKLLYPRDLAPIGEGRQGYLEARSVGSPGSLPTTSLSAVPREECAVTAVAYGYQAGIVQTLIERLAIEEELFVELLVPSQISPVDWEPIEASVATTGALVTVEEGTAGWSWGTELAAEITRRCFEQLRRAPAVLASAAAIIPSAKHLEQEMMIGESTIEKALQAAAR